MQIYPRHNNTDTRQSIRFQQILFWGFLYIASAGIFRKWLFMNGMFANILLFGQLLLPLILAWQYSKTKVQTNSIYKHILVVYFLILVLLALNPLNHTIFHGILGVIIHLGFWYLLLACLQIKDSVNINQLDAFLFIIFFIEVILSSIQYSLPSNHILNKYVGEGRGVAMIGDAPRITGTFSYLGGISALIIFYVFFAWSLLNRNRKPILYILTITFTLFLSLMSGGRANTITAIILILTGIYENSTKIKHYLNHILGIGTVVLILTFFFNPFQIFIRAYDNFEDRASSLTEEGESSNRIYKTYMSALFYHGNQPIFGAGLGSDYQGTNAVLGESYTKKAYGATEEELERIVFEGGYFLLLIRIGLFIVVLSAMRIKRLSKFILFVLFFHRLIVFNTYLTFFLAMGLIWINQSKISNTTTRTICKT